MGYKICVIIATYVGVANEATRDGRWLKLHVTIYHKRNYHDIILASYKIVLYSLKL